MPSVDKEKEVPVILYRDRPEWQDVVPIPADDGHDQPVVAIKYSEVFADVHDYIRGVIMIGELSPRVLALTEDGIRLNAANYTVWQLRRDCLDKLNLFEDKEAVENEFRFCHEMIMDNQKNYQVWHHRKAMVMALLGYDENTRKIGLKEKSALDKIFHDERELTKEVLSCEAKNYHAWQYRQWILRISKDCSHEIDFINGLLADDVRNNSAWNHRYFCLLSRRKELNREILTKERTVTWEYIQQAPFNESPWSYLRGLIKMDEDPEAKVVTRKETISRCKNLLLSSGPNGRPVALLALLIETVDNLLANPSNSNGLEDPKQMYKETVSHLDDLIHHVDPIRKGYWKYMKEKFVSNHSAKFEDDKPSPVTNEPSSVANKSSPASDKTSPVADKSSPVADKPSPVVEGSSSVADDGSSTDVDK